MLSTVQIRSVQQQPRLLGPCPALRLPSTTKCMASTRPDHVSLESKEVARVAAASAMAATFLAGGNALAAQEVVQVADSDGRLGVLFLLVAPALGWVLFNIGGPASRQLDEMSKNKKSVALALGLGGAAALAFSAQQAEAATQVAQLADSDGRLGVLFLLVAPALGWVLFNIGGPASRQLDSMKKSIAVGLGLGGAGLLATQQADAAQVVGSIADSDGRLGVLFLLVAPALGWVIFNIGGPASRQLKDMQK